MEQTTGWTDELLEQQMQAVKDAVHAARSLKTQYNLPNSVGLVTSRRTDAVWSFGLGVGLISSLGDVV